MNMNANFRTEMNCGLYASDHAKEVRRRKKDKRYVKAGSGRCHELRISVKLLALVGTHTVRFDCTFLIEDRLEDLLRRYEKMGHLPYCRFEVHLRKLEQSASISNPSAVYDESSYLLKNRGILYSDRRLSVGPNWPPYLGVGEMRGALIGGRVRVERTVRKWEVGADEMGAACEGISAGDGISQVPVDSVHNTCREYSS